MAPYDDIVKHVSLIEIVLFLIFLHWLFEQFFSGFFCIFLLYLWKSWSAYRKITRFEKAATCTPSVRQIAHEEQSKENVEMLPINETQEPALAASSSRNDPIKLLCIAEVRTMLEEFDEYNDTEKLDLNIEMKELFEEEPSLEEVKEAFDLFDEHNDGFIDSEDLKKALCAMGFTVASEDECRKMITAFDNNGDGRIDFGEFTQLIEQSFR